MGAVADLDTLYDAAIAADASADYGTAARHARAILLRLATIPNAQRSFGGGSQGLTFPGGESVQAFLDRVEKLARGAAVAAGGPFKCSKVTYARPTDG